MICNAELEALTLLQAAAVRELKGSETCAVVTKVHQGKALALEVCRQLLFCTIDKRTALQCADKESFLKHVMPWQTSRKQ